MTHGPAERCDWAEEVRAGAGPSGPPRPRRAQPPQDGQPAADVTPPEPAAPHAPRPRDDRWIRGLVMVATWVEARLSHRRVRSVVIGLLLLVLGATVLSSSVWTLPVLIVGAGLIIVAWAGARLEGRFAIEWGDTGAAIDMRARFKAHDASEVVYARPAPVLSLVRSRPVGRPHGPPPDIEGEAHTVEIDTGELRALIDAAERAASR